MKSEDLRGRVPRKPILKKLTLEFLLIFYEAWLREYEITKIAAALDTTMGTLDLWMAKFPHLVTARDLAIKRRGERHTFANYVFSHLSPDAKELWTKIAFWESSDSANEKVDEILSGKSKRIRQELFIHAMISYSWNPSEACRITGVSRATFETWKKDDLEFRQLVEEINWHKKNFYEEALDDLVAQRNPGAVMFVNRTVNADRGFSEKISIEHSGAVGVGYDIESLAPYLDIETRKKLLEAIRAKKADENKPQQKLIEA